MAQRIIAAAMFTLLAVGVATKSYQADFQSANDQMSKLYQNIGALQSIAGQNGHTSVQEKCTKAKAFLDSAQSSWQDLSTTFASKPWLASEHSSSRSIQNQLSDCGQVLQDIYDQPDVKSDGDSNPYSSTVVECQTTYTSCVSSCDTIWKWQPPSPQPSGGYGGGHGGGYGGGYGGGNDDGYTRKVKRNLSEKDVPACPKSETACPISHTSSGFECIDTNLELTSCGGCVTRNEGEDCSAIIGAAGVGCQEGKCLVLSVQRGYYLDHQGRPVRRSKRN